MSRCIAVLIRVILAATVLCAAPMVASAQTTQTKPCKDGTSSTKSYFACWGHGGVDTTHAAGAGRHDEARVVQAGAPRAKHAKSPATKAAKASTHHAKAERRAAHAGKKEDEGHRGWLPWRHKKAKDADPKKAKKHKSASRLPVPERPNR